MDRRVTPPKRVTSPTWSPPPPCKQALKLPIIYDTLWSVRNRIFSVQIELLLLIASETLGKLGERTGQLWRDNSRRVRTHEKNSGDAVRRLGTIIQSNFCAQSGTSIFLTVWRWFGESRYPGHCQGLFRPCLKTFVAPFNPARLTAPGSPSMLHTRLYKGKILLLIIIFRIWKIAPTWNLASIFVYSSSYISHILDFIY